MGISADSGTGIICDYYRLAPTPSTWSLRTTTHPILVPAERLEELMSERTWQNVLLTGPAEKTPLG